MGADGLRFTLDATVAARHAYGRIYLTWGHHMTRLLTLIVATLLVIAPASAADAPAAPFKTPAAVQAYNGYHYRVAKATEAFEREMAAAKDEYEVGLKKASALASRMGSTDEIDLITKEQMTLAAGTLMRQAVGVWAHTGTHGEYREYTIDVAGDVHAAYGFKMRHRVRGKLTEKGDDLLLYFDDGQIERLHINGKRIVLEHWKAPGSHFNEGKFPDAFSSGNRVR
jgi:hypothetical protein